MVEQVGFMLTEVRGDAHRGEPWGTMGHLRKRVLERA